MENQTHAQNQRVPVIQVSGLKKQYKLGQIGGGTVRKHMDDHPITVTPDTEVNEVRRIMLEKHARYLPVMNAKTLLGVISFYDVARAVLEAQSFENQMLKAYIRDWPAETTD